MPNIPDSMPRLPLIHHTMSVHRHSLQQHTSVHTFAPHCFYCRTCPHPRTATAPQTPPRCMNETLRFYRTTTRYKGARQTDQPMRHAWDSVLLQSAITSPFSLSRLARQLARVHILVVFGTKRMMFTFQHTYIHTHIHAHMRAGTFITTELMLEPFPFDYQVRARFLSEFLFLMVTMLLGKLSLKNNFPSFFRFFWLCADLSTPCLRTNRCATAPAPSPPGTTGEDEAGKQSQLTQRVFGRLPGAVARHQPVCARLITALPIASPVQQHPPFDVFISWMVVC